MASLLRSPHVTMDKSVPGQCQVRVSQKSKKNGQAEWSTCLLWDSSHNWDFWLGVSSVYFTQNDALGCLKAQKFKMWQYGPYNRNAKMHMLYVDHSLWPQKVRGSLTSKLSPRLFQGLFEGIHFPGRPCLAPLMCKSGWQIIQQIAVVELVKSSCSVADCVQSLAENSMCI